MEHLDWHNILTNFVNIDFILNILLSYNYYAQYLLYINLL